MSSSGTLRELCQNLHHVKPSGELKADCNEATDPSIFKERQEYPDAPDAATAHLALAAHGTKVMSLQDVDVMNSGARDRLLALLLLRMW